MFSGDLLKLNAILPPSLIDNLRASLFSAILFSELIESLLESFGSFNFSVVSFFSSLAFVSFFTSALVEIIFSSSFFSGGNLFSSKLDDKPFPIAVANLLAPENSRVFKVLRLEIFKASFVNSCLLSVLTKTSSFDFEASDCFCLFCSRNFETFSRRALSFSVNLSLIDSCSLTFSSS